MATSIIAIPAFSETEKISDPQRYPLEQPKLRTMPITSLPIPISESEQFNKKASEFYWEQDYKNAVATQLKAISALKNEKGEEKVLYTMYEALAQYAEIAKEWEPYSQAISGQIELRKAQKKPDIAFLLVVAGGIEFQAGKYDLAIGHLNEAISLIQKEFGSNSEMLALPCELIGACYLEINDYPKATESFNKVTSPNFKNTKSKDLYLSNLYLGRINEIQGKKVQAAQFYEKATSALSLRVPTSNPYEILHQDNMKYLTNKRLEALKTSK